MITLLLCLLLPPPPPPPPPCPPPLPPPLPPPPDWLDDALQFNLALHLLLALSPMRLLFTLVICSYYCKFFLPPKLINRVSFLAFFSASILLLPTTLPHLPLVQLASTSIRVEACTAADEMCGNLSNSYPSCGPSLISSLSMVCIWFWLCVCSERTHSGSTSSQSCAS